MKAQEFMQEEIAKKFGIRAFPLSLWGITWKNETARYSFLARTQEAPI